MHVNVLHDAQCNVHRADGLVEALYLCYSLFSLIELVVLHFPNIKLQNMIFFIADSDEPGLMASEDPLNNQAFLDPVHLLFILEVSNVPASILNELLNDLNSLYVD